MQTQTELTAPTVATVATELTDLLRRFEQLNDIGASLSSERNIERLLEIILVAAKSITQADGGTLYRVSDDQSALRFAIVRTDSLGLAFGGTAAQPISAQFGDLPLYRDDGGQSNRRPNDSLVAAYATLHAQTVNIADAYAAEGFDFSGTRAFDQATGYRSQSFLTVPLKNHDHQVIGILQLINAIDPISGSVRAFSDADQRLAESLASQAAIALSNRLLISQIETLFESFISLINLAIDEKSPYTGGHSQRMQALTLMLADAAAASNEGELAGFSMNDEDHYELKIASLLHDCGKIATPQHVVDKASKLQTVFDRIALIDTRFEIIRRDAELAALRMAMSAGQNMNERELSHDLHERLAAIDADRDFLRRINIGSKSMTADDQLRVKSISKRYRWCNEAGIECDFLTDDELENLCIRAGTLTDDERQTINNHIVTTIRMLESLPWPQHLKRVPDYAGGHHERMDGNGYPKGLTRDQMPIQARIMGIADIFEALTARDRPYKAAMTLAEALGVLRAMRDNGHIDPDLYSAFVQRRIYLDYAKKYLTPEQIDLSDWPV